MCTKKGVIKKTSLEAYSRPRSNGINAINVREGDELLQARLTNGSMEILLAKKSGKAIRFSEKKVRPMGRTASGVKGVTLENKQDEVIGMVCVNPDSKDTTIMVVSENGYGKRTELEDYRVTGRGGKGVKTINVTEKTGALIGILDVTDEDGLMIINRSGITIRLGVSRLRILGRATQGVKLINIKNNDNIAGVAKVPKDDEEEDLEEGIIADGTEELPPIESEPEEVEDTSNEETDESNEDE